MTPRLSPRSTALSLAGKAAVTHLLLNTRLSDAEIAELHGLSKAAVEKFRKYDEKFLALREEHETHVLEISHIIRRGELKLGFTKVDGKPHAVLYDPRDPADFERQCLYLKNLYRDAKGRIPAYLV